LRRARRQRGGPCRTSDVRRLMGGAWQEVGMAEKQEPAIESMSFEEALNELQSLVKALEKGEAKLEEAIRAYERGAALKQHCERRRPRSRRSPSQPMADFRASQSNSIK